jgi:hypothetical protein
MILLVGSVNAYFETEAVVYISNTTKSIDDTNWYCGLFDNCIKTIGNGSDYYYKKLTTVYHLNPTLADINVYDAIKSSKGPIPLLANIFSQLYPSSTMRAGFVCLNSSDIINITYVRTKHYIELDSSNNITKMESDVKIIDNSLSDDELIIASELTTVISELYIMTNQTPTFNLSQPVCSISHQMPKYSLSSSLLDNLNTYMENINNKYKFHQTTYRIFQIITLITNLIMELWTIAYWIIQLLAITFIIGLILYIFIFLYKLIKTILES